MNQNEHFNQSRTLCLTWTLSFSCVVVRGCRSEKDVDISSRSPQMVRSGNIHRTCHSRWTRGLRTGKSDTQSDTQLVACERTALDRYREMRNSPVQKWQHLIVQYHPMYSLSTKQLYNPLHSLLSSSTTKPPRWSSGKDSPYNQNPSDCNPKPDVRRLIDFPHWP